MSTRLLIRLISPALGLMLLAIPTWAAGDDAATLAAAKCDKTQLLASAKAVKGTYSCKANQLAAVDLASFDATCIDEADAGAGSKFFKLWTKAVLKAAKKGGSGFGTAGPEDVAGDLRAAALSASSVIRDQLVVGANPGDEEQAVRTLNALMAACEKYVIKSLRLHAKHALKPSAAKLADGLTAAEQGIAKAITKQDDASLEPGVGGEPLLDSGTLRAALDGELEALATAITDTPLPLGRFLDSGVEGLHYTDGEGHSGFTLAGGWFPKAPGPMTFSVGDIILGQVTVPPKGVVTPLTLVPGAVDEMHPTVTNIARFLQTIDDDGNPDKKGILITAAVANAAAGLTLDFTNANAVLQTAQDLTDHTSAGSRDAVPADEAQEHMRRTLIALFAGDYAGAFTGSETGTWEFKIHENGKIKGSAYSDQYKKTYGAKGNLESSGGASAAVGKAGDAEWAGTITQNGSVSGTWEYVHEFGGGSFTGSMEE